MECEINLQREAAGGEGGAQQQLQQGEGGEKGVSRGKVR